jgi:hypothetical protein
MTPDLMERVQLLVKKYHIIDEESDRTGAGWDGVMNEHGLDGCCYAHALMELFTVAEDYCKAELLRLEYGTWGEHPDCRLSDWKYEVANGDTRLGYWEWVVVRLELLDFGSRAEPDDKGPACPDNEP